MGFFPSVRPRGTAIGSGSTTTIRKQSQEEDDWNVHDDDDGYDGVGGGGGGRSLMKEKAILGRQQRASGSGFGDGDDDGSRRRLVQLSSHMVRTLTLLSSLSLSQRRRRKRTNDESNDDDSNGGGGKGKNSQRGNGKRSCSRRRNQRHALLFPSQRKRTASMSSTGFSVVDDVRMAGTGDVDDCDDDVDHHHREERDVAVAAAAAAGSTGDDNAAAGRTYRQLDVHDDDDDHDRDDHHHHHRDSDRSTKNDMGPWRRLGLRRRRTTTMEERRRHPVVHVRKVRDDTGRYDLDHDESSSDGSEDGFDVMRDTGGRDDDERSLSGASLLRLMIEEQVEKHRLERKRSSFEQQPVQDQQQPNVPDDKKDEGGNSSLQYPFDHEDTTARTEEVVFVQEVTTKENPHEAIQREEEGQGDDDDDESMLFLRQKPARPRARLNVTMETSVSSLHPLNYTQNNHVLVNYERRKRNLHPFIRNVYMDQLAQRHAQAMAASSRRGEVYHSVSSVQELQAKLFPLPIAGTAGTSATASEDGRTTRTRTASFVVASSPMTGGGGDNSVRSYRSHGNSTKESDDQPATPTATTFHVAENVLSGDSVRSIHDGTMMANNLLSSSSSFNEPTSSSSAKNNNSSNDRKNILSKHFVEFGMGTATSVAVRTKNANVPVGTTTADETPILYMVQLFRSYPPPLPTPPS